MYILNFNFKTFIIILNLFVTSLELFVTLLDYFFFIFQKYEDLKNFCPNNLQ